MLGCPAKTFQGQISMHLNRTGPANTLHARHGAQFHYFLSVGYAEGITGTWKKHVQNQEYHGMHRFCKPVSRPPKNGRMRKRVSLTLPMGGPTSWTLLSKIALNMK
jgi:hypothetical protein